MVNYDYMRRKVFNALSLLLFVLVVSSCGAAFAQTSESYYAQGMEYLRQGRAQEAESTFQIAIYLNKNNGMAYVRLGFIYRMTGRFEEAISACKKAIALLPGSSEAYATMGSAQYELGHNEEALSACKKALQFKSDLPEAYFTIAQIYLAYVNYEKAKENALIARELFQKKGIREGAADVESFLETLDVRKKK